MLIRVATNYSISEFVHDGYWMSGVFLTLSDTHFHSSSCSLDSDSGLLSPPLFQYLWGCWLCLHDPRVDLLKCDHTSQFINCSFTLMPVWPGTNINVALQTFYFCIDSSLCSFLIMLIESLSTHTHSNNSVIPAGSTYFTRKPIPFSYLVLMVTVESFVWNGLVGDFPVHPSM